MNRTRACRVRLAVYAIIGHISGSSGIVTVTGDGSTLTNSGDLIVGLAGSGTLTIADGGTVTVGTEAEGGYYGTSP